MSQRHTPLRTQLPLSRAVGFWTVAAAFVVVMAIAAVPTPLYVLYERRDHFSGLVVTVIFAVYAVGVAVSLFLAGHISDWFGRRRVLIPAILLNAVRGRRVCCLAVAHGTADRAGPVRPVGGGDNGHGDRVSRGVARG